MFGELATQVRAKLALLRDSSLRVDANELACTLRGELEGIDLTNNPHPDGGEPPSAEPSPLDRLERATSVSRDFRAAGKGAEWDRVREYDPKIYGWPKNKQRGQSRGVRKWEDITTVVLHTAGVDGLHPDRWLGVPCHLAVADNASVVLCHEITAYLWAAHAANRFSVSIEIAGNRAITEEQVPPARAALRYVVDMLRSEREGPVFVAPHRFYHKSRAKDCDVMIWESVGEWGMQELSLELGPVLGSGRPLPF